MMMSFKILNLDFIESNVCLDCQKSSLRGSELKKLEELLDRCTGQGE